MHGYVDKHDREPAFDGGVRPVDAYAVTEFTCGGCGAFAVALHDRTGWPIIAELEPDSSGDIAHVWVQDPEGRAVDIQGIHAGARAVTEHAPQRPGRIVRVSRDEAADRDMGPGSYYEWANEILDTHGDRFGLPEPDRAPRP